jgi:hypothetical protein
MVILDPIALPLENPTIPSSYELPILLLLQWEHMKKDNTNTANNIKNNTRGLNFNEDDAIYTISKIQYMIYPEIYCIYGIYFDSVPFE